MKTRQQQFEGALQGLLAMDPAPLPDVKYQAEVEALGARMGFVSLFTAAAWAWDKKRNIPPRATEGDDDE